MSRHVDHSRKAWTAIIGVIVTATLSGCTEGTATTCPPVGMYNHLSVQLTGDASQIEEVRLCDLDGFCSQLDDGRQPVETSSSPLVGGVTPTVASTSPLDEFSPYTASGSGNSWSFRMDDHLERGTITAYYADGSVAAEVTTDFVWERVGSTTECGRQVEAGPIVLPVN